MEQDSDRPDICASVDVHAITELLRRAEDAFDVAAGAEGDRRLRGGDAQARDLDLDEARSRPPDMNGGRTERAMQDVVRVCLRDRVTDRERDVDSLGGLDRAVLGQVRRERRAGDVLSNEPWLSFPRHAGVEDTRDVWAIEPARAARADEEGQTGVVFFRLVQSRLIREDVNRHTRAARQIRRLEANARRAGDHERLDAIPVTEQVPFAE
jgi:hypothetical protein